MSRSNYNNDVTSSRDYDRERRERERDQDGKQHARWTASSEVRDEGLMDRDQRRINRSSSDREFDNRRSSDFDRKYDDDYERSRSRSSGYHSGYSSTYTGNGMPHSSGYGMGGYGSGMHSGYGNGLGMHGYDSGMGGYGMHSGYGSGLGHYGSGYHSGLGMGGYSSGYHLGSSYPTHYSSYPQHYYGSSFGYPHQYSSYSSYPHQYSSFPHHYSMMDYGYPSHYGRGMTGSRSLGRHPVDVIEVGNDYIIEMDLPGHSKDHIETKLFGNELVILSKPPSRDHHDFHLNERSLGRNEISRKLYLPPNAESSKINAALTNGVLRITIPKTASTLGSTATVIPSTSTVLPTTHVPTTHVTTDTTTTTTETRKL